MATLFTQTIIAVVWDFDKTLIPGYMQGPLFEHYGVDERQFWREVNELSRIYRERGSEQVSGEMNYLNHILEYVRRGVFKDLSNEKLGELGASLQFYPGLPEFFGELKETVEREPRYAHHDITLEHYVVSTGFTRTIRGSAIAPYLDGVWGCEFLEDLNAAPPVIAQVGYVLDNTTKTRAVFEINKGVNKHPEQIDVNAAVPEAERRIPFQNMIYIADGPSDVPVFSVVKRSGGYTYGVYNPGQRQEFSQVNELQRQGRVQAFGPADYRQGTQTCMWLTDAVQKIAERIVTDRERALGDKVGKAPRHLSD
ncbi:haloacid dehalogenase-like hydrolase [Thioalkalivibrio denitrificans]|uniref:Haloacid dehalogenase-like hydrolase n=1 Tax=Thioalkalivibrio denitrificans TaxID=108003 RepID=A0A1V3NG24_9GAMM|nr:HAD family hydrolase [Thioalkalivibrio denitrificans]OOG23873.1 haloacid dehalogenase-like hydrolase [Thioalkalivibrio denitrificans]